MPRHLHRHYVLVAVQVSAASGREGLHAAVIDQFQFLQTNGTIKNHVVIEPVSAILLICFVQPIEHLDINIIWCRQADLKGRARMNS